MAKPMGRTTNARSLRGGRKRVELASRAAGTMALMTEARPAASSPRERRVSARIGGIAESATLAVDAKAKALKAEGRPVIGFGAGEPDFPTPAYIVEAAVEACRDPRNHRYTPAGGLPELKQAIADKTRRDSGLRGRSPRRCVVTNGGKQAIYEAFATMLDPGDEVIVPAPYWTTYPEAIQLAGGVAGRRARRRDPGLHGHRRPARGGPHRPHQGAAVRLAVQPDRRGLHRRRDPGDRPVGRGPRAVGAHRRDLRAPGVRRRRDRLDARARARARRQHRRRQRRRQDLRDDRLAGRLDDRADRHRQGRGQPPVARDLQRLQRLPARRARGGQRRPVGRGRDEGGVRPAPARRSCRC